MKHPMQSAFVPAALAVAISAALAPANIVHAQSAADALLEEVIIVATKKADGEELLSAPVAVTAFSEDALDALFVRDISSLSYSVPNVQLEDIGTIPGTANFSIRGIAVNSSIPSIDPAVALVYDGIPLAINTGVIFDTFDLEGVEVLRGPQGTLFGRNATAGAVALRTSAPSDEFSFKAKASTETGLLYRASAVVSGPLVEGVLTAKLGVLYEDDEGYWDNDAPILSALGAGALIEDNLGGRKTTVVRPALRWTPTDTFEVTGKFEFGDISGAPNAAQNFGLNGDDSFSVSVNDTGDLDASWSQVTSEINWDVSFGDGTITNVTGFREYESESDGDIDSSPVTVFHSFARTDHEQFSNELRYSGALGAVDLTAGVFYMDQELTYIEDREIPSAPLPFIGGGVQDVETLGIFAQAEYHVSDAFTLIFGARYSDEEKSGQIERIFASNDCTRTRCSNFDVDLEEGFSTVSPRVGVRYQPDDNTQWYASYTEGVRAGGFNFRNTSPVAPFTPFGEETVNSVELGYKGSFNNNRLRFSGAIFSSEVEDMQREINRADATAGVVQEIRNTADATITGLELEIIASATDNLVLTAMLGLSDGEYDRVLFDISGDGVVDAQDLALDLPRLAETSYGVGAVYDQPLSGGGSVVASLNFSHRDEVAYTDNNLGRLPEIDILDLSLAYHSANGNWKFSVYGKNLLDEISFGNNTQLPPTFPGGPASAIPGTGATFSPLNKGEIVGAEIQFNY